MVKEIDSASFACERCDKAFPGFEEASDHEARDSEHVVLKTSGYLHEKNQPMSSILRIVLQEKGGQRILVDRIVTNFYAGIEAEKIRAKFRKQEAIIN